MYQYINISKSKDYKVSIASTHGSINCNLTIVKVNENGLLSFLTEIPSFFNVQFPLDYPLIAALYSDVDCRVSGTVWYRSTK